jgi:outer membrane protein OmpA-like peptidoglycan-associated protein
MKFKKIFLTAAFTTVALGLAAQETVTVEESETVYRPNWYIQGQIGAQETLGETSFGKLLAPNAQIAVGYNFNSVLGLRLAVNSWRSRAAITIDERYTWKWDYVAPMLDVTCDLTNLIGGYKPSRVVSVGVFAGIGANVAWKNDEANSVNDALKASVNGENTLRNIWDGTKTRLAGQFGATLDFNVAKNWQVGLEAQANVLNDNYNSKLAHNADWYFNLLAGVKYTFGGRSKKVTKTVAVPVAPCEPQVVEKIVEKVVEVPVAAPAQEVATAKAMPLRRDVFFSISTTSIANDQEHKVKEVVDYLNANPDAKVTVTGYADKGTGSKAINLRLAKQRADVVAEAIKKAGISASRIEAKSMSDDMYQPYIDPIQNRVAICIAE